MIYRWILLFYFAPFTASASISCYDLLQVSQQRTLLSPDEAYIYFSDVDIFRRNNDVGLQQNGTLGFVKWFKLDADVENQSYIGLTEDGVLYHLVPFSSERPMARRLSGQKQIADFWLTQETQELVVVDQQGRSFVYRSHIWSRSPLRALLRRAGASWLAMTAVTIALLKSQFSPDDVTLLQNLLTVQGYEPVVPIAWLMTFLFPMLRYYESSNTFPEGLARIRWQPGEPLNEALLATTRLEGEPLFPPEFFEDVPSTSHIHSEPIN